MDSVRRPVVTRTDSPGSRRAQAEGSQHQPRTRRRPRRRSVARNLAVCAAVGATLAVAAPMAGAAPVLDLETLTAPQAAAMMESGELTSVELTRAYLSRIEALNKRGPGLNAVTQLNQDALKEAAIADRERAQGIVRGPAHGMPVLMKDLIDVKGMYTSAGNYSLRNSFPEKDSGVAAELRDDGAIILGKLGLSEYANFFGNQPSGFANLTGQVVHGLDADQNPSGSSSGSGAASAAALGLLVIGTETSGSIISPSNANGVVGIRPTIGLVPGDGIAPIAASQDTAGPMDRTVADAAYTLQAIARPDTSPYAGLWDSRPPDDPGTVSDPRINDDDIVPPPPSSEVPDYLSALDLDFVQGKRIGYTGDPTIPGPFKDAYDALADAGAILVPRPAPSLTGLPGSVLSYEAKRDINRYYANLGPLAPIKTLEEEIATNILESDQALKFGHNTHLNAQNNNDLDPYSPSSVTYRANLRVGKQRTQDFINGMIANFTPADTEDDFIAILGPLNNGTLARAGTPTITIPMGYNEAQRRTVNVQVHGTAYSERDLIGVAYVIEQATKKRQPASQVNPSMYRCTDTVPAPLFSERGACNPDYDEIMAMLGGPAPKLDFALELESAESLQARMSANSKLTAETLTRAYLARIALTNAEGPAIQAVRVINAGALVRAKALDVERKQKGPRGPLHGIPVLVDEGIDVKGLPTTGGSIALQNNMPTDSADIVKKLEAAGAIILGKANITELNGTVDTGMPAGYSSLAGQVMLPNDTDKPPAGSSAGSAAATAAGLAAMAIGLETGTDGAQLIAPAERAGVVGLKPTVGLVSTAGILPVATTQDAPGPITRSVRDAAAQLQATVDAPEPADYLGAAETTDLTGKRIAVLSTSTGPYGTAVNILQGLGATTAVRSIGTPSPNPTSIVQREFKRDIEAYLAGTTGPGPKTLQGIIDYNLANPVEGLKYQQRGLEAANAIDLSDPAVEAAYESDKTQGLASNRALIDAILANDPDDPSDDFDAVMVNRNNGLLNIAARAGYPMLTMTVGEGTGNEGRNPVGVVLVGTAFSEEKLIGVAAALEQAPDSYVRRAPSVTNPSMWRCVPGSAFFTKELCHPGDRMYDGLSSTSRVPALPALPGQAPASPAQPATKGPKT